MRKLLIVIDMQNDFIDAALGTKEAVSIVEAVKEKIRSYPAADVIATMDTHGENYMDTQEGKYLPVPHCIRGTEGWKIRPDIEGGGPESAVGQGGDRAGADWPLHGHLRCFQRAAPEGGDAGGEDLCGCLLLRRGHAGKTRGSAGDYALLPDPDRLNHIWEKKELTINE